MEQGPLQAEELKDLEMKLERICWVLAQHCYLVTAMIPPPLNPLPQVSLQLTGELIDLTSARLASVGSIIFFPTLG